MAVVLDARRPEDIEQAAELIRLGQLVAFPTDTLYGVGADVSNPDAIEKLYAAKNRSKDKGIPVLLASKTDISDIAQDIAPSARTLMDRFWPGPLTLILRKRADLAAGLSPNTGIAVRVPGNKVAQNLIRQTGGAIAATSANRSGSKPALTAEEARLALGDSIAAVLDGGPVQLGVASTILDFTCRPPKLVRPGPISASDLQLEEMDSV
jgi:L-threonylcarbamoyladenylate synthase